MSKLIKRLFVASEMEGAGIWANVRKPDALDEILLSVKGHWEFSIELIKLMDNEGHLRLKMFSDSWRALTEAPEVFKVLSGFHSKGERDGRLVWPELIRALEGVGWQKQKPEPREMPKPPVCAACGRP